MSWIWVALLSLVGSLHLPSFQTNVTLTSFTADAGTNSITVQWETASETDNLGFRLWRSQELNDNYVDISGFIPSSDEGAGALYKYTDSDVTAGVTYYYKLQDIPGDGSPGSFTDPVSATISLNATATPTPTSTRTVTPTPTQTPLTTPMPTPANIPGESEPNDTVATADPLAVPGKIFGAIPNIYDTDCFSINTILGLRYRLVLTDYMFTRWLKVYDHNGYYTMGNTTAANHMLAMTLQATDTRYYLCVSAVNNASPSYELVDYLLEVAILQPTPTPTPTPPPTRNTCAAAARLRSTSFTAPIVINRPQSPNAAEIEPNDSFAAANTFVIPGFMTGAINPFGDEDYFRMNTTSAQIYTIDFIRTDTQERRIDVYTNAYIWVASAQTDPINDMVSLSFTSSTTLYYIRVSAPNNDSTAGPTDYRIDVTPPTPPPTNTPTPTVPPQHLP